MWGAYFCMGAYKRDVVVVIKIGAYIHGVLILCGCLLSRFYGMHVYLSHFNWYGQLARAHRHCIHAVVSTLVKSINGARAVST